ncbi:MAG: hypothetical protein ACFFG0_32485 [Candidatus Thorarchaeota archaeon]
MGKKIVKFESDKFKIENDLLNVQKKAKELKKIVPSRLLFNFKKDKDEIDSINKMIDKIIANSHFLIIRIKKK